VPKMALDLIAETQPVTELASGIFVANRTTEEFPGRYGIVWEDLQLTGVVDGDEVDLFSGIPVIEGAEELTAYAYAEYRAEEDPSSETLRLILRDIKQRDFARAVPPPLRVPMDGIRPQELEITVTGLNPHHGIGDKPEVVADLKARETYYRWVFDHYVQKYDVTVYKDISWSERRKVELPHGFDGFFSNVLRQMLKGGGHRLPMEYLNSRPPS